MSIGNEYNKVASHNFAIDPAGQSHNVESFGAKPDLGAAPSESLDNILKNDM